jgi:hypothetical protein
MIQIIDPAHVSFRFDGIEYSVDIVDVLEWAPDLEYEHLDGGFDVPHFVTRSCRPGVADLKESQLIEYIQTHFNEWKVLE